MGSCDSSLSEELSIDTSIYIVIIPVGFLMVWSFLTMTCLRSPKRKVQKRDVLQFSHHLASIIWTVGYCITLQRDWQDDEASLCGKVCALQQGGSILQKFFIVLIWYIRLGSLIGPIYPYWVRYPCLLLMVGFPVLFVVEMSTVSGELETMDNSPNTCAYSGPIGEFSLISCISLIPSVLFLLLFIVPFYQFHLTKVSDFVKVMMWHMAITMINITCETALLIAYLTYDKIADGFGLHHLQCWRNVILLHLLISNILIIYVFCDWHERLFWFSGSCCYCCKPKIRFSLTPQLTKPTVSESSEKYSRTLTVIEVDNRWKESAFIGDFLQEMSESEKVEVELQEIPKLSISDERDGKKLVTPKLSVSDGMEQLNKNGTDV